MQRQSLDSLYAQTRDPLFTVFYHLCGDAETAEDLLHETFLRVWERRDRIAVEVSAMSYLCTIGFNLWRNQCRHGNVVRRSTPLVPVRVPPEPDERERQQAVAAAVADLPVELREVLTLHHHAGLTFEQIGALLVISPRTVEARLRRAFDRLRLALKDCLEREMP